MSKKTVSFKSNLGHLEIDEILEQLEVVFVSNISEVKTVEIVKYSDDHFETTFTINVPKGAENEEYANKVLTKEAINMSLYEVGLTGYLI